MMLFRHEQQSTYQVRRADTLCALDNLHTACQLHLLVRVLAVRRRTHVVSMHHVLTVELVQQLYAGVVRRVEHHLVHPLARAHRGESLLVVHDGRALVLEYLVVTVHAYYQYVGQRLGLADGVVVAGVHDVEAAVDVRANGSTRGGGGGGGGMAESGGGRRVGLIVGVEQRVEGGLRGC